MQLDWEGKLIQKPQAASRYSGVTIPPDSTATADTSIP